MNVYHQLRAESLRQVKELTLEAGDSLTQMHQEHLDAPGGVYAFPAVKVYRLAALFSLIAERLENEAGFYDIYAKRGTK